MADLARAAPDWARVAVARAKPVVRSAWRDHVLRSGTDITAWTAPRSALVVAPHPDDESIGCGATIARKRAAGAEVHVVVVCDGRSSHPFSQHVAPDELAALRSRELVAACAALGVPAHATHQLGHPDGSVAEDLSPVVDELVRLLDALQPDELYLPSPLDWHPDHAAVNRAGRVAWSHRDRPLRVLEYPVWFWAEGPWSASNGSGRLGKVAHLLGDPVLAWRLRAELVSTDGHLEAKRAAIAEHRTQTQNLTGEESWATLPPEWFEPFLQRWEVFLPVPHPTLPGGWQPDRRVGRFGRSPSPGDNPIAIDRVSDRFDDDRAPGTVLGSIGPRGALRLGRDAEARIGIDHDALRMPTLTTPGWGRESIAYGPVTRRPGRAMAAFLLNGHNTSQSDTRPEGCRARAGRWVREAPQLQFNAIRPHHLDNLAVGWFADEVPSDPYAASHCFVMRAATVLNGELRVGVGGAPLTVHRGVQNLPMYYVVVLRSSGATYYVASVDGAAGASGHPFMRPVGVDPRPLGAVDLFPGVHQCVLGEVGYRVSTRVYGIEVADVPGLEHWWTTAQFADELVGNGPLQDATPARGQRWQLRRGRAERTARGLVATEPFAAAVALDEPLGLLHVRVISGAEPSPLRITIRADATGEGWTLRVGPDGASVGESAPDARWRLEAGATHSLQVTDDGEQIGVHLDGRLVGDRWFRAERDSGDHVVVELEPGTTCLRELEVHPRQLPLPAELDQGAPWSPAPETTVVSGGFPPGEGDLDGAATVDGSRRWERTLGAGVFLRQPDGTVAVDADLGRPCHGRTLYTLPWASPSFAELEIEAVPPGRGRGEGHAGRGGVVFWQDAMNHLVVNPWLDDYPDHDGSSVSAFLRAGGREDMYEAVWSNVGREVHWGRPYRLRVAFDGRQFLAWINGQPVLYRAITDIDPDARPIEIRRVGIATNWEWGDDTGTRFRSFTARA